MKHYRQKITPRKIQNLPPHSLLLIVSCHKSKVAKTVLTIPCSSAKSERVFSCAGNFSTKKRSKLGLKKLEDLVVLKQNHESIASFKVKYPHLKIVTDRNSFDKIRMEETGIQEPEDPLDHALLCGDTVESDEEVDTSEDED